MQRDSKDPRVHFYYAMLLNQHGPPNETSSAEIKKELQTTIALDPKLADAYSLLGYTQASSGEPEKGMATLKKAVELSPRNEHYLFNLANVYMMNQKVDDAIAIFRSLAGSGNPEVAMRSNQALAQAITFQEQTKTFEARLENHSAQNAQPLREPSDHEMTQPAAGPMQVSAAAVRFLKGKLVSVDCSFTPQALLRGGGGSEVCQVTYP